MGKDDDEERTICGACLGEGGNWEDVNGTEDNKGRKWVKCRACNKSGSE
ncbi:hypothetical protein ACWEJ6_52190 [Nonomuraea sp. NPDC004702]